MSASTRLVFWVHPVLGLMADLPDGTRRPKLSRSDVRRIAAEWAETRLRERDGGRP